MKILLATPLYPPEIGGPATYAKLLATELPKRGVEIEILPFSTVCYLPKGIRHIAYFLKVIRLGRTSDIIFAQDIFSVGLPALWAAKLLKKKFVVRVPGDYAWEQARVRWGVTDTIETFQQKKYTWKIELVRLLTRKVVRGADLVITPSDYFRNLVNGWLPKRNAITIYNGIALEHMQNYEKQKNPKFTIVSAGRMVPWKRFDGLVRVIKNHPDWQLILIGDGPEKERLIQYAHDTAVSDQVVFKKGLSQNELFTEIAQAHVFVLNSTFESFSFQVVEAMALGVPVVATRGCNLEEIIVDQEDGILIPMNSDTALQKALIALSQDSELRERFARNAKIKAQAFSIDRTIDKLTKALEFLV